MPLLILPAFEYTRSRWRNGNGWTREIVALPSTEDFDWRVSIADIDQNGSFSTFPGYRRQQQLLDGEGVELDFDDGPIQRLEPPHGRAAFAGDQPAWARLLDGPTRVFNLIHRESINAELLHRPLVGSMVFFCAPGEHWLIHLRGGQASCRCGPRLEQLEQGDSALLSGWESSERLLLEGGGELLLIHLPPASRD